MKLINHRLQEPIASFIDCPKNKTPFENNQPDSIIIHYTAAINGLQSANYLARNDVKASAHIVIDRDGSVIQLIPFNIKAWHAGQSEFNGRSAYNNFSIGIELANAGPLTEQGNRLVTWFGAEVEKDDAIWAIHKNENKPRWWHSFTQAQIEKCIELCELLSKEYPIKEILGHDDISPGRKSDPGPAFPLKKLADKVLFNDRSEDAHDEKEAQKSLFEVSASSLNVRSGAGVGNAIIDEPLKQGTTIKIQDRVGDWVKVEYTKSGWVHSDYIRQKL